MTRIIDVLNKKWAIVFAVIPGINLMYLVFHFLTVEDKRYRVPIWILGVAGAPLYILFLFVPDSWYWLVTHLIFSEYAFMVMRKSRGGYQTHFRFQKEHIEVMCLLLLCLVFFLWYSSHIYESNQISNNTRKALDAIIHDDEETWKSLLHPVYGTNIINIEDVKNDWLSDGIVLQENYSFGGKSVSYNFDVEDGKATETVKRLDLGDEVYRLTVVYQESENGSGFIEFKITDDWSKEG